MFCFFNSVLQKQLLSILLGYYLQTNIVQAKAYIRSLLDVFLEQLDLTVKTLL